MQGVIPIGVKCEKVWVDVPVTAAWGGAGTAVADTTDSVSVTLFNSGRVPIEYRIGSGAWTRLEERHSDLLLVSLASTTIRLRKTESGVAGAVSLQIESLTTEYVADGHEVEIGDGSGEGGGGVGGSIQAFVTTVTEDTTLDATNYTVLVDATDGAVVINLPSAASAYSAGMGRLYQIKKIDASDNTVTVAPVETIDAFATLDLTLQWQSVTIQSNGTSWSLL